MHLLVVILKNQLKRKETVCVIPDGSLWEVPFQALQTRNDRYLLQEYALYYAPSLDVLREMSKKSQNTQPIAFSLLAFGNPLIGNEVATNLKATYRGETLAPLPDAETEVKALKEIWGAEHKKELFEKTFEVDVRFTDR